MTTFTRRLYQITSIPKLSASQYAMAFKAICNEIDDNGFHLLETPKAVRERCTAAGESVTRSAISAIVRLIGKGGHRFAQGAQEPEFLRREFTKSIMKLCADAGWELDDRERYLLLEWIGTSELPSFHRLEESGKDPT